jgi:hypothetical protein
MFASHWIHSFVTFTFGPKAPKNYDQASSSSYTSRFWSSRVNSVLMYACEFTLSHRLLLEVEALEDFINPQSKTGRDHVILFGSILHSTLKSSVT